MGVPAQHSFDWGCGWLNDEYLDRRLEQLRDAEAII